MGNIEGNAAELREGVEVETDTRHEVKLLNHKLRIKLQIDPKQASSWDDRFMLFAELDGKRYRQLRTVKDDLVEGDDCVTIEYQHLMEDATYTLVVDPGKEGRPYECFSAVAFADLFP